MELNKKNIKRVLLLIACAILLYWGLNNLSVLGGLLSSILSLFSPLLIGVGIAYVMNLLLMAIERLWDKALKKAPELWRVKLKPHLPDPRVPAVFGHYLCHYLHSYSPFGGGGHHAGGQCADVYHPDTGLVG